MTVCSLALLFHVMAAHGAFWEGAAAAWMLAAFMDACLAGFLIYRLTEKSAR